MKHILVTGCQRSGTRFYANYLAKLNKMKYIDENDFEIHELEKLVEILEKPSVIQAPALKNQVKKFKLLFPGSIVIWMYRERKECLESMKRIKWEGTNLELMKIKEIINPDDMSDLIEATLKLGFYYFERGLVDQIINMKSIEHLEGFKKNKGVVKLV